MQATHDILNPITANGSVVRVYSANGSINAPVSAAMGSVYEVFSRFGSVMGPVSAPQGSIYWIHAGQAIKQATAKFDIWSIDAGQDVLDDITSPLCTKSAMVRSWRSTARRCDAASMRPAAKPR